MSDVKNLRRLTRAELLELLLEKTKEAEKLRKQLEIAETALTDRNIRIAQAGDLAEAVLSVNGVLDAAQAAAKQYLDNIEKMKEETQKNCRQILAQAYADAEKIRAKANPETDTLDMLLEDVDALLSDNEQATQENE